MELDATEHAYLSQFLDEIRELDAFYPLEAVAPTTQGHLGTTPLHVAAVRGDCRAIALLARAGADLDARGEHGFTPLHEAAQQGKVDAVLILLQQGASGSARTHDGDSAAELASLTNSPDTAQEISAILARFV